MRQTLIDPLYIFYTLCRGRPLGYILQTGISFIYSVIHQSIHPFIHFFIYPSQKCLLPNTFSRKMYLIHLNICNFGFYGPTFKKHSALTGWHICPCPSLKVFLNCSVEKAISGFFRFSGVQINKKKQFTSYRCSGGMI